MTRTYRIVAGFDHSPSAELALQRAFELASYQEHGEVHVIYVIPYMGDFLASGVTTVATGPTGPLQEIHRSLEARVGELLAAWRKSSGKDIARLVTHVRSDAPALEVVQLARDLDADLVVVGTHGRRGFSRFLLGSVAENVVRLAHTPVLVVRPQEEGPEVPEIEPPCPRCVATRTQTNGELFWCEQHQERHGQRHTYHYSDRVSQPVNAPLLFR